MLSKAWYHLKPKLLLLIIMTTVFGCTSEGTTGGESAGVNGDMTSGMTGGVAVIVSDVYYIRTSTDAGPVYLSASRLYGAQRVGGENLDSIPIENAAIAWRFAGEETFTVRSQSSLIESTTNLVVRANDGQMQIAMVDDGEANSEYANWRLMPLDNGRCHLVNVDLGNELALSVVNPVILPNGSARYSVEMTGIDNALNQQWTIVRVGNPPGQFEQLCGEVQE